MDNEAFLILATLAPRIWWTFMKPYAIAVLVSEIDTGVDELLEDERLLWESFPMEMDILDRMDLAKRALVRSV